MTTTIVSLSTRIGEKGRVVVPAELRRIAGFHADTEVVMWSDGAGRIIMETQAAARQRVWEAAPTAQADATAEVRAMRDADNAISDRNAERRAPRGSAESKAAGRRLLKELGL